MHILSTADRSRTRCRRNHAGVAVSFGVGFGGREGHAGGFGGDTFGHHGLRGGGGGGRGGGGRRRVFENDALRLVLLKLIADEPPPRRCLAAIVQTVEKHVPARVLVTVVDSADE